MMNDKFMKLLEKKKASKLSDNEKEAKMCALKDLHGVAVDELKNSLSDHMKGMNKVTVAAKDKPSLEEGLDKAKELLEQLPSKEDEEESDEEEAPASLEDLDRQIKELEMKKKLLLAKE